MEKIELFRYPLLAWPTPCAATWGGSDGSPCRQREAGYRVRVGDDLPVDACPACWYTLLYQRASFRGDAPVVRVPEVGELVTARTVPPGRLWALSRVDEDGNGVLMRVSTDPLALAGPRVAFAPLADVAPVGDAWLLPDLLSVFEEHH